MDRPSSPPSENIGINLPTPIERDYDTLDLPVTSTSEAFPAVNTAANHRHRSTAPSPPRPFDGESGEQTAEYYTGLTSSAEKRRRSTASTHVPFDSLERGNDYKRHRRNISSIDMSDKENAEELAERHGCVALPSIEDYEQDQAETAALRARRDREHEETDEAGDTTPTAFRRVSLTPESYTAMLECEAQMYGRTVAQMDITHRARDMYQRIIDYFTREAERNPGDARLELRAEAVTCAASRKYDRMVDDDGDEVIHSDTESEIASILGRERLLKEEAETSGEDGGDDENEGQSVEVTDHPCARSQALGQEARAEADGGAIS